MLRYIVIGEDYCKYCKLAISLLEKEGLNYEYYNLDKKGKIIVKHFKHIIPKNHKTIPIILVVDEKFLGGFDNLYKIITKKRKNKSRKKKK